MPQGNIALGVMKGLLACEPHLFMFCKELLNLLDIWLYSSGWMSIVSY